MSELPLWADSHRILDALEREAPRAHGPLGAALHRQGFARLLGVRAEMDRVVVRGEVREGDEAIFRSVVHVRPSRVDARCDCGAPEWPCPHVLAVARAWASGESPERPDRTRGWRAVLQALAPGRSRPPVVPGRSALAHWVALRPVGAGVWGLEVRWRAYRLTSRGPGRGRSLSIAELLATPPAFLTPEDEEVLRLCRGEDEGRRDGAVRVSGEVAHRVLQVLGRVGAVHWEEGGEAARFDPNPVGIELSIEPAGGGARLRLSWREFDGSPWASGPRRVVAASPPWVESEGVFRSVHGAEDAAALAAVAAGDLSIPERDLPAFLGMAAPELEAHGIRVEASSLDHREFSVDEVPTPRLYLTEEDGGLAGELRFRYGDFEISSATPEPVVKVSAAGRKAFVRRDPEAEFQATLRLRTVGFAPVDPGHFRIEGEEALDFVRVQLAPLAEEWEVFGQDQMRRHRVSRATPTLVVRAAAMDEWLEVSVEASAGETSVDPASLAAALARGGRYVRLGDGSHALLPQEWGRRIGPALQELGLSDGLARVPPHMAPVVADLLAATGNGEVAPGPRWEDLSAALQAREPEGEGECPVPAELRDVLRPYQVAGYRWLRRMARAGLGCVLADDMGLGKTVQALAVLLADAREGNTRPSLVVTPTSVVPTWEAEATRFVKPLRVLRYQGASRQLPPEGMGGYDLVVTSYAVLRRDVRELAAVEWSYAILDEAQAIKNAATQTARAAARLQARKRLALTGTPLENHLGELWSQFRFVAPGLLGSERNFSRRFLRPVLDGDRRALEELQRRVRPFILRRLKAEVAPELPEKVEAVLLCEMGPEQERLYRTLLTGYRERVFRELRERGLPGARFSALEALLRLRQACCHPEVLPQGAGRGIPSAKFDAFREFVSEIVSEGHRVLVFSQFVTVLGMLRGWFEEAGIPHLYLDGRTRDREARVRRFQEDQGIAAFLVSLRAGGTGLNLTGADYVILYDPWWNPAVETQALDRAHRIGQTRKVFAYRFVTRGTVEEKISRLQERKRSLSQDLIRSERQWSEALSEGELEELFAP